MFKDQEGHMPMEGPTTENPSKGKQKNKTNKSATNNLIKYNHLVKKESNLLISKLAMNMWDMLTNTMRGKKYHSNIVKYNEWH